MRKDGYNILLAGDAAGQVKATTGGGIFFGASCGIIAGKNFTSPSAYEREWKSQFGVDLSMHRHFRSALNFLGGEPHSLILSAAKALFFEDLISEKGKMDRWSEMLQPTLPLSYAEIVGRRIFGALA
jgi:flavin-dependent dehydrogenase